eukprot:TRINITY_DN4485_c0_g1_i1.p1 TRINITY_DN4485_c0_g1~~TRINITY_DN4485_c0_g1_i1.p1  ORF type:complete len:353 (+),score=63.44 TRINITY_DN4485_c0_g1_i1:113-1171(+)
MAATDVDTLNKLFHNWASEYSPDQRKKWDCIDPRSLTFQKLLGEGTSAYVYKGVWKRPKFPNETDSPKYRKKKAKMDAAQETENVVVAIKVIKDSVTSKLWEDFKKELKIMMRVRGPLIIEFHGLSLQPKYAVVMEFCERGSLFDVLNSTDWACTWDKFFSYGLQCIQSVSSLHKREQQIVHRDLKSLNFLVTGDDQIKLCDFGLSRQTEEGSLDGGSVINTMKTLHSCRGTYCYTAPEVYQSQKYTDKADVFSLAIILWELLVRTMKGVYERPYSDQNFTADFQVLIGVSNKGIRPRLPPGTPARIEALLKQCWETDPTKRKNVDQLCASFNMVRSNYLQTRAAWDALITK